MGTTQIYQLGNKEKSSGYDPTPLFFTSCLWYYFPSAPLGSYFICCWGGVNKSFLFLDASLSYPSLICPSITRAGERTGHSTYQNVLDAGISIAAVRVRDLFEPLIWHLMQGLGIVPMALSGLSARPISQEQLQMGDDIISESGKTWRSRDDVTPALDT